MSFNLSKLIQTFMEPANALALLLLLAALMAFSRFEAAQRLGRRLVTLLAILFVLFAALPVGEWALAPLEDRFAHVGLPDKIDGIVFLTGDENPGRSEARGQPVAGYASARYIRLAHLARRYPHAPIIVTGDTAPNYKSKITTQTVAKEIMAATGIDLARVTFEDKALTTFDNARYTARLVRPDKNDTWLLVTSAWHMPRSVLCFEHQNMKVIPAPTDYMTSGHTHLGLHLDLSRQFMLLRIAAHEYYGLVGYWLSGMIERPWP